MDGYVRAQISASAVAHNLELLRAQLAPGTRLCAVVKADCYGHGLPLLLDTITQHADFLAVATPEEALGLRDLGYEGPILAFFSPCAFGSNGQMEQALEELVSRRVSLTVVAAQEVEAIAQAARRVGQQPDVHLKVDTGMGRSGIRPADAAELAAKVRSSGLRLEGMYSHFASADEADKSYAAIQFANFRAALKAVGGPDGMALHMANSAAVIDLPEAHLNMVRPGIAMYGYQPSDEMHRRLALKPALRVVGPLLQIKDVPAGSRCGYGLTHTFARDSRVGLVPIGYGDGYLRCLSGLATMRAAGRDVPVCGRVSMDQTILDLTDVPQARMGDEVEIISNDPAAPHSVENLARLAGTIPYELTCRLGGRVQRVKVE